MSSSTPPSSHSNEHGASKEFIVLMAFIISLVALSIDAMLPALPDIGRDLGVNEPNRNQLIVSILMLGMAVGQMIYGPLSDSIGRKPAIHLGYGLFIIGSLLSIFATDFNIMLLGRLLQGVGVSGPRIVAVALIRDRFEGRMMAQVLSYVMSVFIIVPAMAPAVGQAILLFTEWQGIFVLLLLMAIAALVWLQLRQPETLTPERRKPFSLRNILRAIREVCYTPVALGFTLVTGIVQGAFLAYLNTAQQLFQVEYGLGEHFPAVFAALALAIGLASVANARLVVRFGMQKIATYALMAVSVISLICFVVSAMMGGLPPLSVLMGFLLPLLFCVGLLFGNLNALAMGPLGHIAGVGAAVVGCLSTLVSVPIGIVIGQAFNGTVLPLIGGFALLGVLALIVVLIIRSKLGEIH
ncbi:MFS transporter [Pokkaliibacter plantistimulans]|uniref:MFS transporter n=1 Tax=Pokkaliibacter plantistimulans TaxID=1635171 RepID=A0ABX5LUU0_9GAMM|nr:multidrug effflux MFS transporter [Pokkaliibacter plantistimulans]PXF30417.1 MFS transporter [Pokkaliibacter plantistimulans]